MMRTARLLILLLALAATLRAQQSDPIGVSWIAKAVDPIANRLFLMPTGRIIKPEQPIVGTLGPTGAQGFYAPSKFMQLHLGGFYSPTNDYFSYITSGMKIQAYGPHGLFQGLAVGADFGLLYSRKAPYYRGAVMSYNVATSFGNSDMMVHLNATGLPYGTTDTATLNVRYLLQGGLSVPLYADANQGFKAIAEVTGGGVGARDMHFVFAAGGLRWFTGNFVGELGVAAGPKCFGDCADKGMMVYKIPYINLTFIP